MNNPLATTFRRPTTPLRRSWQSPKDNSRARLTRTLQFEINQYSERIKALRAENKRLHSILSALNTYKSGSNASPLLIQHFQSELNSISEIINKRAIRLGNLETKVKSARAIIASDPSTQGEKARLLSENSHLIDVAFYQEQVSIAELSKLRILHDIRNLYKYKQYAQDIIDGKNVDFNYEEEEINNKKKRIENLKRAIEYEKSRILSMQAPQFEINEAAKMIQKHWRGFYQRQQDIKYKNDAKAKEFEHEIEEEIEYNTDSVNSEHFDSYSDNADEANDDGVFNVTGVPNPERGSDEENEINTPADALNSHKSQNQNHEKNKSFDHFPKKSPKRYSTARNNEKTEITENDQFKEREIKQEINNNRKTKSLYTNHNINPKLNKSANKQKNNQINETENGLGKFKLETLNPQTTHNTKTPLDIKTYMSD